MASYLDQLKSTSSPEAYQKLLDLLSYGGTPQDYQAQIFTGLDTSKFNLPKTINAGKYVDVPTSNYDEYGFETPGATKRQWQAAPTPEGFTPQYSYESNGEFTDQKLIGYTKDLGTVNGIPIVANYDAQGNLTGYSGDQRMRNFVSGNQSYAGQWDAEGKAAPRQYTSGGGGFLSGVLGNIGGAVTDVLGSDLGKAALLGGAAYLGAGALAGGGAAPALTGYDAAMADLAASAPAFSGAVPAAAAAGGGALASGGGAPALTGYDAAMADLAASAPAVSELAPAAAGAGAGALASGAGAAGAGAAGAGAGTGAALGAGAGAAAAGTLGGLAVPAAIIGSSLIGANAAGSAADTQAAATNRANEIALQMYQEQKKLQEPFVGAGVTAQNRLLTLLGLPGGDANSPDYGSANKPFTMNELTTDPSYQFRLGEGLKSLDRQAAARGGLISGQALKAAQDFGQQSASQEYQNAFNRYQTNRTNMLQPLGNLLASGQSAAANAGSAAANYGTTAGNNITSGAAAQAAGTIGQANALTGGVSQYLNYDTNNNLLNLLAKQRQSQYGVPT